MSQEADAHFVNTPARKIVPIVSAAVDQGPSWFSAIRIQAFTRLQRGVPRAW